MKLDLKLKLLILLVIPLFFVIGFSLTFISNIMDEKKNLEFSKHHILEAEGISRVMHLLQIERGVTTQIVSDAKSDVKLKELLEIRKASDVSIKELRSRFTSCKTCINNDSITLLDSLLQREQLQLPKQTTNQVREYYTKNIAALLSLIKIIPSSIDEKTNRNHIQSYSHLSQAKEFFGEIRALVTQILSDKDFSEESFSHLMEYLSIYHLETQNFKLTADPKMLHFYEKTFVGKEVQNSLEMIDIVLSKRQESLATLSSALWFESATHSIDSLKKVEDHLFATVYTLINEKLDSTSYKLMTLLLFLAISAIVVTFLLLAITRKILFSATVLEGEYDSSLLLLEQYKATVDGGFIVSKTDANGIITYVNDEFCKLSGYTKEELLGHTHNVVKHPTSSPETFAALWHTIKDLKQPWVGEVKNLSKDGTTHWLKAIISPIISKEGDIIEYIAMRTDITAQKEITKYFEDQLKISTNNFNCSMHLSKEYEKAIDSSTILLRTDVHGVITYANEKFLQISHFSQEELVGENFNFIIAPQEHVANHPSLWDGIIKNRAKTGEVFWTKTTIVPIKSLDGDIIEYFQIRFDITEIMRHREEFERAANTDSLTGCGNRFRLNNDMQRLENLSIVIFNIDNFRQINDFYGHDFGDLVIKSTADKIYEFISHDKNFRFYRLQGDEFIALAVDYSKELLVEKTKAVLELIKKKFYVRNEEILLSCSAGLSCEPKESLLATANMALKIAKKSNIDYLLYTPEISLEQQYKENIRWTRKLSHAIKEGNLQAYYQPIIDNVTLQKNKYECLVRIVEDSKAISPVHFLGVAKQTRQYADITRAVLYQAFELFKDKDIHFSVNLSILDILEPQTTSYILQMLQEYDIGSRVIFEIVESESIDNFDGITDFIREAKKYNCKIAIDDFGTGYSNFEYLIKMQADYLKIDGSLIKNLNKDKNALLIVSTIVDFSKKLGMKTVAEFVENEEIFEIVKSIGVDYSQGYYFSEAKKEL
ncbi:EAL domain-containing protein [Sulfurimonas sp.]|uniref:EAL domain-containing protein n=1 Tax=Sulfurimonas sp. TaxID=2022749 RepID=UPI003D11F75F